MNNIDLVGYLTVCLVVAGTPGPGTIAVINQSLTNGVKRTIPLIVGIGIGLACASAIAIGSLLYSYTIAPWAYRMMGICGASYLCYLGLKLIAASKKSVHLETNSDTALVSNLVLQGFYISLFNPKTILFLLAIYPLYINSKLTFGGNFINLTVSLVIVTAFIHIIYSLLCSKIASVMDVNTRFIMRITGSIFILFSLMIFINAM
ncbi:LysE family translocator [Oceanimonas smirnovii]|uniref:LysE family translocator n=1 Tax=Oceanimonas smirnovii TaxID=264574 RepID=UPI00037B6439|nr:LysE family translocator [Oceanimonas smirnovii]